MASMACLSRMGIDTLSTLAVTSNTPEATTRCLNSGLSAGGGGRGTGVKGRGWGQRERMGQVGGFEGGGDRVRLRVVGIKRVEVGGEREERVGLRLALTGGPEVADQPSNNVNIAHLLPGMLELHSCMWQGSFREG
jgi:hypothetical protein